MAKVIYLKEFGSENIPDLLEAYEGYLFETDRVRSTRIYLGDVRGFIQWVVGRQGKFRPQLVTPLDLVDYRDHLQSQPGRKGGTMAAVTVNRKLVSLRVFFGWLHKQRVIFDNPVADIRPVGMPPVQAPKWLTRNEQNNLMRVVREINRIRDYALIAMLLHTGLRVGELCRLKVEDIEISQRGGHVFIRGGKGNKDRYVPLNRTIRKILDRWITENTEDDLWPNRYGKPISERGVYKLIAKYTYMAKIEREVSPHSLRHTFGKDLVDRGEPLERVAELMGHSDINVTRIYIRPSMDDLQQSVERIAWE